VTEKWQYAQYTQAGRGIFQAGKSSRKIGRFQKPLCFQAHGGAFIAYCQAAI
jgi:chloramphenicol O-acetyltransferase